MNQMEVQEMDNTQFKVRIPRELHKDLKVYCAKNDITMQEFAIRAVQEEIKRQNDTYSKAV